MKSNLKQSLALALMAAFASLSASAQTLYFGTNGNGGSGAWDNGITADWALAPAGTSIVWANGDAAIFGGTAGTATIAAGGVTASGLTFNTAGDIITGGVLTLTPTTGKTVSIAVNANATISSTLSETTGDFYTQGPVFSGGGTLTFTAAPTFAGQIAVNGGTTLVFGNNTSTSGDATGTNYFVLGGGSTIVYNNNLQHGESDVVHGTGNVTYEGYGGGYLNLNGVSINTGTTTVQLNNGSTSQVYDDTLFVDYAGALSSNATLNMISGVVDLRASDTVAGLTGSGGAIATDSASTALVLTSRTAQGQTYTYSGALGASTVAGTVGFTNNNLSFAVSGSGTQILSGANTYTNTTYIQGGTLELTGSLASASVLTSNGINGIFDLDGSATSSAKTQSLGALTFASGEGTIEEVLGTASSDILTFSSESRTAGGIGNFTTVGGTNGSTVKTVITGKATGFIDQGTFFGLGAANAAYASYDSTGYVRAFNYSTDTGGSTVAGGSTLGSTTAASHVETTGAITAQTTATVGTVQLAAANGSNTLAIGSGQTLTSSGVLLTGTGSGDSAGAVSGGTLSGGSNELVLAANQAGDKLTVSSTIDSTSTGGVTQGGLGTVVLTGTNSYTGATSSAAGTLQIGNGTSGSLAAAYAGNFQTGGTIAFDLPAATTTYTGNVTGAGGISQMANTVILTGTNSYAGPTTVAAGATLQFGNATGGSAGGVTGQMTVGLGGNIIFDDNAAENAAPVSGAGNVTFEGQTAGYYSVGNTNGSAAGSLGGASSQTGTINDLTISGTTTINMVQSTGAAGYNGVIFAGPNGLSANSVVNFISGNIDMRGNETVAGLTGGAATNGIVSDGARGVTTPVLTITTAAATNYTFAGTIGMVSGDTYSNTPAMAVNYNGLGTQTLSGTLNYNGGTTVSSGKLILTGASSGTGATTVSGGTLVVAAASSGGGNTTVSGGTLLVDQGGNAGSGGITAGAISVAGTSSSAKATLGGNGTLGATSGSLTVGNFGVLAPGDSTDAFGTTNKFTLTADQGVTMNTGSTLAFTLNGATPQTQYSVLSLGSTGNESVALNGTVNLQLSLNYNPTVNTVFTLTSNNSANNLGTFNGSTGIFTQLNGVADNLTQGSTFVLNGDTFTVNYNGGSGDDLALTVTAVPEPSSLAMMATGLLALFGWNRYFRLKKIFA